MWAIASIEIMGLTVGLWGTQFPDQAYQRVG